MLLNKFDKEKIISNIVVEKIIIGKTIHLNWKAGKLSYILDMKSIWTNAQQKYLDERFNKIENRLETLENDVADLKTEIKTINNKIDLIFQTLQTITKQLNDIQSRKHD